eukprot:CAMPEP_0115662176 /NCGR_PEP_ID=MMETSP0272-20121206/47174_1 /TAXON_ID=71861 /ORGANISM="Scrippsiella trochoidea, Strain CCMP3099" /LENGTH=77 /DNA_ID=CAMNT_0003100453 /DNA_START=533 /DNA_END=764 /DNA_ORIENTATION=-
MLRIPISAAVRSMPPLAIRAQPQQRLLGLISRPPDEVTTKALVPLALKVQIPKRGAVQVEAAVAVVGTSEAPGGHNW